MSTDREGDHGQASRRSLDRRSHRPQHRARRAVSGPAVAEQFTVASCQADRLNFSTTAFSDFATRGMRIRRACNPEGRAARSRHGELERPRHRASRRGGARGDLRARGDAIYDVPLGGLAAAARLPLRAAALRGGTGDQADRAQERAGEPALPARARAQAAGYRSRTFNVDGATRIVQRVICQGGGGRRSCSARGANYIRTYQAEVGIADDQPPTATIAGDTPLATGAWVGGGQPLNYAADDNVGIQQATASAETSQGGGDHRPCALATPRSVRLQGAVSQWRRAASAVDTTAHEGTQALVVRAQDTAGNTGDSAPVTARIDNSAPARVDTSVEGDQWRNSNDFALAWTNPTEVDRAPIAAAAYKLCSAGAGSCNQGEQAGEAISRLAVQAQDRASGPSRVAARCRGQRGSGRCVGAGDAAL